MPQVGLCCPQNAEKDNPRRPSLRFWPRPCLLLRAVWRNDLKGRRVGPMAGLMARIRKWLGMGKKP